MSQMPTFPPRIFRPKVHFSDERPRAEAANFVHLAYRNLDMQLLVGYIDAAKFADLSDAAAHSTSESTITVEVVGRYSMSPTTFAQLKAQIADIESKMSPSFRALVADAEKELFARRGGA